MPGPDRARDRINLKFHGTTTKTTGQPPRQPRRRRIALGADHAGYEFKEALKQHLQPRALASGFGDEIKDPAMIPGIRPTVGEPVAAGGAEFGLLICTSGSA